MDEKAVLMSDKTDRDHRRGTRARRAVRAWRWVAVPVGALLASVLAAGVLFVVLLQDGMTLSPGLVTKLEAEATRALPDGLSADLGAVELTLVRGFKPQVHVTGVTLSDAQGAVLSDLPDLTVQFARRSLLGARMRPEAVAIDGSDLVLRRDLDGTLQLGFDAGGSLPTADTLAGLVARIDAVFDTDMLAHLAAVEIRDLSLTVDDLRAGRTFRMAGGTMRLTRDARMLSIALDAGMDTDAATARLALRLSTARDSAETLLAVEVTDLPARLLAEQSVYLSWLKALDAPVSARFRGGLLADGGLSDLSGALDLGAGRLRLPGLDQPIRTERAKAYIGYDPARRRLALTGLDLVSDLVTMRADGYAYLHSIEDPFRSVMGQVRLSRIALVASDQYDSPVQLDSVIADLRVDTQAGRVDIGQIVATQDGARLRGQGRIDITDNGPRLRLDAGIGALPVTQAQAFWPRSVKSRTRAYFKDNMTQGTLRDVTLALRQAAGGTPMLAVTGAFDGLRMRYLPKIPAVEDGRGHFSVLDGRVTVQLDHGVLRPPGTAPVDVSGSSLQAFDLDQRPGTGVVGLRASGPVQALLAATAPAPIGASDRLGIAPDALTGMAELQGEIRFPLAFDLPRDQVRVTLNGTLAGLASDTLVAGQSVRAGRATLRVSDGVAALTGAARISDVPIRLSLHQPLEDGTDGRLTGSFSLSAQNLEKLGISLPDGFMTGAAPARFDIGLRPAAPPRIIVTSELRGMGMAITPLGWRKRPDSAGELSMTAILGAAPEVTALSLRVPGLEAKGRLQLAQGGGLDRASLGTVRIGTWLDVSADLIGRGAGQPMDIAVTGGRVDLAGLPASDAGPVGQTGPGTPRGQITLALDRVRIAEGLALTGLTGTVAPGQSLSLQARARLNDAAPVRIAATGARTGTSIRVRSDDAGAVLTAVGILDKARGGTLDLRLSPKSGARRSGSLDIANLTVVEAPVLTQLLSAVSVIGLVEQISAGGLFFAETTAKISIGDDGVLITEARAQGPSLGLTTRGLVGTDAGGQLDLSGVVSPFYLVNRVYGALVSRRGEGLIGFNYTMTGPRADPKVRVNPLSILTPGALREIFRRPLPKVDQ